MRFQKIDELTVCDHYHLNLEADKCWYMFNYTAGAGFSYSKTNSLISNLKKEVKLIGTPQYQYKLNAITEIASYFSEIECNSVTLVPIPPSKAKSDPLYDDRIVRILKLAFGGNPQADIREMVLRINSVTPAHSSTNRPTINQIEENLTIDQSLTANVRGTIFLVDDVLTTGASFVAVKRLINRALPNIHVVGLFVCRRAIEVAAPFGIE